VSRPCNRFAIDPVGAQCQCLRFERLRLLTPPADECEPHWTARCRGHRRRPRSTGPPGSSARRRGRSALAHVQVRVAARGSLRSRRSPRTRARQATQHLSQRSGRSPQSASLRTSANTGPRWPLRRCPVAHYAEPVRRLPGAARPRCPDNLRRRRPLRPATCRTASLCTVSADCLAPHWRSRRRRTEPLRKMPGAPRAPRFGRSHQPRAHTNTFAQVGRAARLARQRRESIGRIKGRYRARRLRCTVALLVGIAQERGVTGNDVPVGNIPLRSSGVNTLASIGANRQLAHETRRTEVKAWNLFTPPQTWSGQSSATMSSPRWRAGTDDQCRIRTQWGAQEAPSGTATRSRQAVMAKLRRRRAQRWPSVRAAGLRCP
jgi:hypothetical protein